MKFMPFIYRILGALPGFRPESDQQCLSRLKAEGIDLSESQIAEFDLIFFSADDARRAANALGSKKFRTITRTGRWNAHLVTAARRLLVRESTVATMRTELSALATSHGGFFEQWDVSLDAWNDYENLIRARVEQAMASECLVKYSAYSSDEHGLPTDNLDEVAWPGACRFAAKADRFFGDGDDYESPVVDSPTWLDVARLANEMIQRTRNRHHVFLEGIRELTVADGVAVLSFQMGS